MSDQAAGLRRLADQRRGTLHGRRAGGSTRVVCITSGKGGVGKTNLAANIGICLSQLGNRVLLFDADLGLANLDMVLGITPRATLEHLVRGEVARIEDIVAEGPGGVRLVAGGSGIRELALLSERGRERLLEGVLGLQDYADVLLMDTGAGIHESVLSFVASANEVIIVTTPEPPSMADAYAIAKVLVGQEVQARLHVIANMCRDDGEGLEAMNRLRHVAHQFLGVRIEPLGWVPRDERVMIAVRRRHPFVLATPGCPAARSVRGIAEALSQSACKTRAGFGLACAVERLKESLLARRLATYLDRRSRA